MTDIKILYNQLLQPSIVLLSDIADLDGDILILGVGGKMGPALAKLAKPTVDPAAVNKKVIGVSRFSNPGLQALSPMLVGWLRYRGRGHLNGIGALILLTLTGIVTVAMVPRKTNTT